MQKEDAKKWAEIFQAIADGKEIELIMQESNMIKDDHFSFNLRHSEWYRIKPEPEYIPFEREDYNQFMFKEVRRKGENFKDETWKVFGASEVIVILTEDLKNPFADWTRKLYSSMFEEWEFIDGKPFGKIKE